MRLPYLAAVLVFDLLLLAPTVVAADCQASGALWLQPSTQWLGIDGQWSFFAVQVGSGPPQTVYLSPATALSELWVVQPSGCSPLQVCYQARGDVFSIGGSRTWTPLGPFELGVNNTGYGGHGDYGMDTISITNAVTRRTTEIQQVLIAGINDTNYYQGFIGVGNTPVRFKTSVAQNSIALPFITQLASTFGTIPSHSYGYTAGAFYRDIPGSLTFGGYDTTRFVPHDTTFSLTASDRMPMVRIRGVSADVTSLDKAPSNWTSTSQTLVAMNDSITAIIDTSTPYLWLPTEVCERFATALNLKWNETLGVYVYANGPQYTRFVSEKFLSFTFSLSSYDNADDFGQPLQVRGVVNITLSSAAFAHVLKYPFGNVIEFGAPGIPYFPLKRSTPEINNNRYIIGRAFMQEAYIITKYDSATFSLHEALYPSDPLRGYQLKDIERPGNSPYDAYAGKCENHEGLSVSKTVGIVLSAFAAGSVIGFVLWFLCWRKRGKRGKRGKRRPGTAVEESKDDTRSIDGLPKSPVKRMFSRIVGRKPSKRPVTEEGVRGTSTQPAEVGADEHHQVFEMPVPIAPVELDSHDIGDEETDMGGTGSHGLTEYELTRRKLERQLQGPVPTYTPSEEHGSMTHGKSAQDVTHLAHYRPADDPSPVSSPTDGTGSLPLGGLPSPLSPHPDWRTRMFDFPSPMTVAPPAHLAPISVASDPSASGGSGGSNYSPVSPHTPYSPQTYAPSSVSRSNSNGISPTSPVGSMRLPPTPTCQRTPIDPSRVICLGPLPENVQLPHQQPSLTSLRSRSTPQQPSMTSMRSAQQHPPLMSMRSIPQIVTPDRSVSQGGGPLSRRQQPARENLAAIRRSRSSRGSNDSLGSNFTMEEENQLTGGESSARPPTQAPPPPPPATDDFPRSPRSMERIETGCELVHVPQVADKRYSWEER